VALLVVDAVAVNVVEKDEEVRLDNDDIAAAAVVPVPMAVDKRRKMSPFQMMMVGSRDVEDVEDVLDDVDTLDVLLELMQVAVVRRKWRMVPKSNG
jgi:hypothetical protein